MAKTRTESYRQNGECENAEIVYGDAPNQHFPDRREVKNLKWCPNPAEYAVTGHSIPRTSLYCGSCVEAIRARAVERGYTLPKIEKLSEVR